MIGYFRSISAHADAIAASERALVETAVPELRESVARGTTLVNAATAYKAAGRLQEALPLYVEALSVYERTLSPGAPLWSGLYNNIASLHLASGDYEKALDALKKAAAALAGRSGADMEAATVDTNIALVLFKLGREDEAKEVLDKALAVFDRMRAGGGARPSHYASALAALAQAYYTTRRYGEAAEVYVKALDELRFHYGENQDYAVTCRNYALVLDALGRAGEAEEYRRTAKLIVDRLANARGGA